MLENFTLDWTGASPPARKGMRAEAGAMSAITSGQ